MHRFFVTHPLITGQSIHLEKDEDHHLRRVMRIREGERIELIDGQGTLAVGIVGEEIHIESLKQHKPPLYKQILAQGLPDFKNLSTIVEKATELGITDFWIFPTKKSKSTALSKERLNRLQKITISAMKQSKGLFLPTIHVFASADELPKGELDLFIACPRATKSITVSNKRDRSILVGPESGFTETEMKFFTKKLGAIPIKLSENVLRTETAAIVASYLISL